MVFGWLGFLLLVAYLALAAWMFDLSPLRWHSIQKIAAPSSARRERVSARIQRVGLVRWFSLLVLALICFALAGTSGR
jgi:hypothetical protein